METGFPHSYGGIKACRVKSDHATRSRPFVAQIVFVWSEADQTRHTLRRVAWNRITQHTADLLLHKSYSLDLKQIKRDMRQKMWLHSREFLRDPKGVPKYRPPCRD